MGSGRGLHQPSFLTSLPVLACKKQEQVGKWDVLLGNGLRSTEEAVPVYPKKALFKALYKLPFGDYDESKNVCSKSSTEQRIDL